MLYISSHSALNIGVNVSLIQTCLNSNLYERYATQCGDANWMHSSKWKRNKREKGTKLTPFPQFYELAALLEHNLRGDWCAL